MNVYEPMDLQAIFDFVQNLRRNRRNIFFRGQSKVSYKLISSLSREFMLEYQSAQDEVEKCKVILNLIQKEIDLYNEFKNKNEQYLKFIQSSSGINTDDNLIKRFDNCNEKNIVSIMQHFGVHTRCLDLTYNLFTALFFATRHIKNEEPPQEQAALWIVDECKLIERYLNKEQSQYRTYPVDLSINLETSSSYIETVHSAKSLYETRIKKIEKNRRIYMDNCLDFKTPEIEEWLAEVRMDIEERSVFGLERYSTLEKDLYSGGLNERICRQNGLFIIQGFKPIDMVEEFQDDRDVPGQEPFIKIPINIDHIKSINNFLSDMGIDEKTLGIV